jgi:hypothetical protein
MRAILAVLALFAGLTVTGCAGPNGADDSRFINVRLVAGSQNQGNIGQAGLTAQGAITGINLFLGGVPSGMGSPLQVYTYLYAGSCAQLGAQPAFALNENVRASRGNTGWYLTKTAPLSLSALRAEPYAIVLRSSPADRSLELFCGDID